MSVFDALPSPDDDEDGSSFSPGARLEFPIFDDRNVLLLRQGMELTPRIVDLLRSYLVELHLDAALEVLSEAQRGLRIPLPDLSRITVGRRKECAIRPNSRMVSGFHAELFKRRLSLQVCDRGSTNGTFRNGCRLHGLVTLADGDLLEFGDVAFKVRMVATLRGAAKEVQTIAGLIIANREGELAEPTESATVSGGVDRATFDRLLAERALGEHEFDEPSTPHPGFSVFS